MISRLGNALVIASAALLGLAGCDAPPHSSAAPVYLAITGGTLIDPDSVAPPAVATILIRGDRIVAVGGDVAIPRGARRIDARGRFVVPGLWDMHAHVAVDPPALYAPEHYVGHGVLGIRDMGGYLQPLLDLRRAIATGARTGPAVVMAGPTLNGEAFGGWHRAVGDPAEARAAVIELKAAGVDFIKTHRATSRPAFLAMADEARRQGLRLSGHVPLAISFEDAAAAGMASVEHVQTLLENEVSDARSPAKDIPEAVARIEGTRGDALFAALARHRTAFDPTLVGYEATWEGDPPDRARRKQELYARMRLFVGRAARAGVTIVAGSDVLGRHGDVLLTELERLVASGLTTRQALAAATTEAYSLAGSGPGRIVAGGEASLLLIDADPLADIRNLRRLSALLLRGRVIEAAELAALRDRK